MRLIIQPLGVLPLCRRMIATSRHTFLRSRLTACSDPTLLSTLRHHQRMALSSSAASIPPENPTTAAAAASPTPMADTIHTKLTEAFSPQTLSLHNDSHKHSHHMAMRTHPAHTGQGAAPETHFRVHIVSGAFEGKMPPARHRMVYAALREELALEGGVHALQITARTPGEEHKRLEKEAAAAAAAS